MPSFIATPAQMLWTGGEVTLEPIRFGYTAEALNWAGGTLVVGPNLTTGLTVATPRLDRLTRGQQYYDNKGVVSVQMQALWQKNVESVESSFTNLTSQLAAIQAALDAATAAQATATAAALAAQEVANSTTLANSYTVPIYGILTATSAGVITIAAHQRYYSADNIVNVDAGSITGLTENLFYRVSYVDAAWAGGAVTYEATTDTVTQTGATHVVGAVAIPVLGDPPASGDGTTPPGYIKTPVDLR
jgi:hypothetical protein